MERPSADISRQIALAHRAEPGALDRLLEGYRQYMRLLARMWIDRALQQKADPSDLVQETLIKAHQRFGQFQGQTEAELVVWLRQILARNVADFARRYRATMRQSRREQSLEQMLDTSADALQNLVMAESSSPSDSAQRRELGVVLADALADLAPDHREVIVLRNLEELDWDAIGQRLGRTADAARMLWARALKELRPRIEARL
jgi:RNA polymerase sigma-70 factor (ECF subfamily)